MAGKYTECEKQAKSLHIVLLPEAREDVRTIAEAELDADSKLAESLDGNWAMGGHGCAQKRLVP